MKISKEFLLILFQLPKIGRKTAISIINECDFDINSDSDFKQLIKGLPAKFNFSDLDMNNAFCKAESIMEKSEVAGIKLFSFFDDDYPPVLKKIDNPPLFINVKGDIQLLHKKIGVAIIGTRKPSPYGKKVGVRLGKVFGENGFNVVSGLAKGCDTYAHTGCLFEGHGITTAVMANGLDMVYPKENTELFKSILDAGGVAVSEYFAGTRGMRNYFVERDRIQAALSRAVIVIETDIEGGTMHTVKFSKKYGKLLACLNHPNDMRSISSTQGNQQLIKEGAIALTDKEDVTNLMELIRNDNQSNQWHNEKTMEQGKLWE